MGIFLKFKKYFVDSRNIFLIHLWCIELCKNIPIQFWEFFWNKHFFHPLVLRIHPWIQICRHFLLFFLFPLSLFLRLLGLLFQPLCFLLWEQIVGWGVGPVCFPLTPRWNILDSIPSTWPGIPFLLSWASSWWFASAANTWSPSSSYSMFCILHL